MQKYWARKPANVVARYVSYYTNPGDIVFDPFAGSGVTAIEAVRSGRNAVAIDLNPVACFLTHATLRSTNVDGLVSCIGRLRSAVEDKINSYYVARCSKCEEEAVATHVVWKTQKYKGDQIYRVKVHCENCDGSGERPPSDDDLERYERIGAEAIPFFYPKDVALHITAKRSVEFIHELFTHRALICLSILLHEIDRFPLYREELRLAFMSTLAQVSRMPPYAESSGISWKVPNYWVPPTHWERHVWQAFDERLKKLVRGKKETPNDALVNYSVQQADATQLPIAADSIDYIFTDPPYGDALPYLGLSMMWAAWLQFHQQLPFEQEILIPERGDYEAQLQTYRGRLAQAFREMFRVLKNNGTVTVTFHNREIRVWNALVSAACEAGFVYANDNYVLPAVKSSKAQLAVSGSMTGDVYINFFKPPKAQRQEPLDFSQIHEMLIREATMIIESRNGQATTDHSRKLVEPSDVLDSIAEAA
jgi:16S rRNA G966 N2-methylase RsmD